MTGRPTRSGYTLTEVLIATVLVVVLMTACWNLMSLYGSFLKAGRSEVRERQLARSLFQLVEQDIRLINAPTLRVQKQPALPARIPDLSADLELFTPPTERFAPLSPLTNLSETELKTDNTIRFEGASDWLSVTYLAEPTRVDAEVVDPALSSRDGEADDETANPGAEAHTILYFFNGPEPRLPADQVLPFGLHRIEATTFDLQGARQQSVAEQVGGAAGRSNSVFGRQAYDVLFEPNDELTELLDAVVEPGFEPTHDHAPEIVRVEFQYHDGQRWHGSWNTHNRQSLPVLLRVTWWVISADELQTLQETLDVQAISEEEPEELPGIRPRRYQRTITLGTMPIPDEEDRGGTE